MNFIEKIYEFNDKAGLLANGTNIHKETAYVIEEMLEGFKGYKNIARTQGLPEEIYKTPKDFSRWFSKNLGDFHGDKVDVVDKFVDAMVFAIGALFKEGLTAKDVEKCMDIVAVANMQKVSQPVDAEGKLTKPKDFVPPEEQIRQYLKGKVDGI